MRIADLRELIRENKSFRKFYIAVLISLFGDWFSFVAISDFLLEVDQNKSVIAYLMIFHLLPFIFFSPFAGALADKISRRKILYYSDLIRFIIVILIIIAIQLKSVVLILGLLFFQYSFTAFYEPAASSLVPNLVKGKHLFLANASISAAWSIMMSLGMALGGFLVFLTNTEIAMVFDSLTFLISFLIIRTVYVKETHIKKEYNFRIKDLIPIEDYKEAYHYMKQRLYLIPIVLSKAALEIAVGAFVFYLTIFGESKFMLLGSSALGIGLLQSSRGIGTGLGPILARKIFRNQKTEYFSLSIWLLVIPIAYFFMSLQDSLFLAMFLVMIAHIGGGANWVVSENLIHELVEDKYRGRIISFEYAAMTLVMSISIRAASLGLDKYSWTVETGTQIFAVIGAFVSIFWAFISFKIYRKSNASAVLIHFR